MRQLIPLIIIFDPSNITFTEITPSFNFYNLLRCIFFIFKPMKSINWNRCWLTILDLSLLPSTVSSNSSCDGMNLDCALQENVIPCLEFKIEFQFNQLIYQKEYTEQQQIIYHFISHLHDREGWGYQKITNWLNKSFILANIGKNWLTSSVMS